MAKVTTHAHVARVRDWAGWVIEPVRQWFTDRCSTMSASIAFYAAFSLAPTLVIVIAVASFFFGADAVQGRLFGNIRHVVGDQTAAALQAMVASAWHADMAKGTTVLSLVAIAVGASATFAALNAALNVICPIVTTRAGARESLISLIKVRLISFGLVIGVGFLVVALLILDAAVAIVGRWVWGESNPSFIAADAAQLLVSFVLLVSAFSALLKFLPDAPMHWRDTSIGAVAAALFFNGGKRLFSFYLAHAGMANTFGAAGSLAVILMWLYYSAAVFLLGAEVAAFSRMRRLKTVDARTAPARA